MSNLSSQVEIGKVTSSSKSDHTITSAAKGGGILLGGQLFAYMGRFATGIVLARFLGAHEYGLYNLTLTVLEIIAGLASIGLAMTLVRYIPILVSRQDKNRLWGLIQIGLGIPTIFSILLGVGLFFGANIIAKELFNEPGFAPLLQLISPVIAFYTMVDMIAAATRGFKNMHYTVIAQNIVLSIVKIGLILAFAIFGMNAARAITATTLTEVIVCGLLLFFLNKQFPLKPPFPKAQYEIGEFMRFSLPNYMSNLVTTFSGNIRTLLLGSFYSIADVGIFAVARQINLMSDMFHSSLVSVSQPIVAELSNRGDKEQLKRYYHTTSRWSFTLNFPMFLIVILFPGAIISIFGQSFAQGIVVLKILAWAGLINTGTGICGVLLDMSGNTHLKLVNTITSVVATIGLSFALVPTWGLMGAAIASLTAAVIINLLRLVEVFILFRLLPYDLNFLKPLTAGSVAFVVGWGINLLVPVGTNLVQLLLNILILLGAYVGVTLLLGLSREDYLILTRLRQRFSISSK